MTVIDQSTILTPDEYLTGEAEATIKSEYCAGALYPMAGSTTNHNRIAVSISTVLDSTLEVGRCEVFNSDVRLWVPSYDLFTYPDIMVICGETEYYAGRTDSVLNPVVIGEVLSRSTGGYDQGAKFAMYRSLPSLQEYLLIDQYRLHVDHFQKVATGRWLLTEFENPEDLVTLESINVKISLRQIYRRVDWSLVD